MLRLQDKRTGTLKEQLATLRPQLEALRHKKEDRMKQFLEVKRQIANISGEIAATQATDFYPSGGDQDLTLRRLEEYNAQLQKLQRERVGKPSFWEMNIQCNLQLSRLQGLLW